MTKLDDLRSYLKNKDNDKDDVKAPKKETVSLEVAGSDASTSPLSSFGNSDMDPDIIEQLYQSPRNRVPRGEGASYLDQD